MFMPSLIIYRLTGEFVTDTTMAGTSMLTDNKTRNFSEDILVPLGLDQSVFPFLSEPGTVVGSVKSGVAEALGVKNGIAVITSGHDTQFAILGSGAGLNQPVLSSGTWEILMIRALAGKLKLPERNSGLTVEFDSQPGLVDIGVQWVASGVLEWIGRVFYSELSRSLSYSTMTDEAKSIPPGAGGLTIVPELFSGGFSNKQGEISGFTNETTRAHVYRAAVEALSYYTRFALSRLQSAFLPLGSYESTLALANGKDLICVGGGSKNKLWNQIRSDVLGIPVKVPDISDTTAIGAAITTLTAVGIYDSTAEAFEAMKFNHMEYLPGKDHKRYQELYSEYIEKVF